MRRTFVILPQLLSFCFASGPKIVAEIDYAFQNKKLRDCIKDTTDHYIEERGTSSDRLPFSASQIYQLCLATSGQDTQNSEKTYTPKPPQFRTSLSPPTTTSFVQPSTVTLPHVSSDISVSQTIQDIVTIDTTLTTPVQETSVSIIQTSTVTVPLTQPSQITFTEPSTVVFGPHRPPTMSPAMRKQEREKHLKELSNLNIFMQILSGIIG